MPALLKRHDCAANERSMIFRSEQQKRIILLTDAHHASACRPILHLQPSAGHHITRNGVLFMTVRCRRCDASLHIALGCAALVLCTKLQHASRPGHARLHTCSHA